jgi:hypothetical protein
MALPQTRPTLYFKSGLIKIGRRYDLAGMGSAAEEAVPALIQVLAKDERAGVRQAAAGALEAITGRTFGEDAARWQAWW